MPVRRLIELYFLCWQNNNQAHLSNPATQYLRLSHNKFSLPPGIPDIAASPIPSQQIEISIAGNQKTNHLNLGRLNQNSAAHLAKHPFNYQLFDVKSSNVES